MITRSAETTREEEAIAWARRTIDYTKQKISLGSVNKYTDTLNPEYFKVTSELQKMRNNKKHFLQKLMLTLTFSPDKNQDIKLLKLKMKALIYERFKVGNCKEQVTVALAYLKKNGFDDVDLCDMLGGDHTFLLLNGCIICDPWADKIYHVKDFAKEREAAKSFRYADVVYSEIPDVKSYMFGIPRVKQCTGKYASPSIVSGQFVRSGVGNLQIDYSEFVQAAQAELDALHGKGVKIFSLNEFLWQTPLDSKLTIQKNI